MDDPYAASWDLLNQADRLAMDKLFSLHADYVYRLALSRLGAVSDAEDVTQDVFLRLIKNRRQHTQRAKFRTWLYRVTSNVVTDLLRRRGRLTLSPEPPDLVQAANQDDQLTLHQAIAVMSQLPQRQREAVLLREFEGFSTAETAEALGISAGSVKTHLHRGLQRLRELLEPKT